MHRQYIYLKDGIKSYPYHEILRGIPRKENTGYCHDLHEKKIGFSERSVEGIINFASQKKFKCSNDYYVTFEASIKFPLENAEGKLRNCALQIIELLTKAKVLIILYNNKNPAWPIIQTRTLLLPGRPVEFTFTLPISVSGNVITSKDAEKLKIHELASLEIKSYKAFQTLIANFANKYNKISKISNDDEHGETIADIVVPAMISTKGLVCEHKDGDEQGNRVDTRDGTTEETALDDELGEIVVDIVIPAIISTQGLVDKLKDGDEQGHRVDTRDGTTEETALDDELGETVADIVIPEMSCTQGLVNEQKDGDEQGDRVDTRVGTTVGIVLGDKPGETVADIVTPEISCIPGWSYDSLIDTDLQQALVKIEDMKIDDEMDLTFSSENGESEYSQDEEKRSEVFDQTQYNYLYLKPEIPLQGNYDLFLNHYFKLSAESKSLDLDLKKLCFEMFILDVKSQDNMIENWNGYLTKFSKKIKTKMVIHQQGEYLLKCANENHTALSTCGITPTTFVYNKGLKNRIYSNMRNDQKKYYDSMARNLSKRIDTIVHHLASRVHELFVEFQQLDGYGKSNMLQKMESDREVNKFRFFTDDSVFIAVIQNSKHEDMMKLSNVCSYKKERKTVRSSFNDRNPSPYELRKSDTDINYSIYGQSSIRRGTKRKALCDDLDVPLKVNVIDVTSPFDLSDTKNSSHSILNVDRSAPFKPFLQATSKNNQSAHVSLQSSHFLLESTDADVGDSLNVDSNRIAPLDAKGERYNHTSPFIHSLP
jgi:hypothetical protein